MKKISSLVKLIVIRSATLQYLVLALRIKRLKDTFENSEKYWSKRYAQGGNSGPGSTNHDLANFKASMINAFIESKNIYTIIEFGCGDGAQLRLAKYPKYIGFDISDSAINLCIQFFHQDATKKFKLLNSYNDEKGELCLSLDVIYHLIEDEAYINYMHVLFSSSTKYVIIYSSNTNKQEFIQPPHVKHRAFTHWIEKNLTNWALIQFIPNKYPYNGNRYNTTFSDFYIYQKTHN